MTREEAIKLLVNAIYSDEFQGNEDLTTAYSMAIKSLEQETCDDAVSRQAVLNTLNNMDSTLDENRTVESYKELLAACYNDLPSVTPTHKRCHNANTDYAECDQFVCSNCGIELQDWHRVERDKDGDITYHEYEFNYCPHCGAKID